jgi:mono/diheme cytochrome c family protein
MSNERQSKNPAARPGIVVTLAALACAGIAAVGTVRAAAAEGWYTQDQAQRGHQLYNNYCAQCHRPDLKGAEGPALVGDAFLRKWSSKTLADLFNYEHSTMPATTPGSLPDDTMWAITAYILQRNGFPAGPASLNQQTAANLVLAR